MQRKNNQPPLHRMIFWILLGGVCCLVSFGCASPGPKVAPAGFLTDYSRLKDDPVEKGVKYWEAEGVAWKKYNRLMIDPVQMKVVETEETKVYEVSVKEKEELARKLREATVEAVKVKYSVVDQPGPDVLRIRMALTHLKPISPLGNVVSTIVLWWPIDVGEAALEAQFIDSQSGKILMELTAASEGSTAAVTKVWTRWSQVEAGFAEWAQKLKIALDEMHK